MISRVLRSANALTTTRRYRAYARVCRTNCYLSGYVLAPIHLCEAEIMPLQLLIAINHSSLLFSLHMLSNAKEYNCTIARMRGEIVKTYGSNNYLNDINDLSHIII